MKVYVVNVGFDYEGEGTVGVHASRDDAIAHVAAEKKCDAYGDDWTIYEAEVGSRDEPKEVWSYRTHGLPVETE